MIDQPTALVVQAVHKSFAKRQEHGSIKSIFATIHRQSKRQSKTNLQSVLKGIDLDIKKGEFFGIVGRNGSGKSTLLKVIAGIYRPSSGNVQVNGRLVPFIELGVGFNPELTGKENVYLNGAILGFSRQEMHKMYPDIVSFAELSQHMDKPLKNYSSGMQVRLAFSIAIRSRADILLLDEVLAVGDADFQRKCYDYFKGLKKNHTTVVFITHDMSAVREYCDRAALLENGEIKMRGQADKIANEYERMFIKPTHAPSEQPQTQNRWGNGKLKYHKPQLELTEKELSITVKLRALEATEAFSVGFSIKDAAGQIITGTNTSLLRQPFLSLGAQQTRIITWRIPHIFKDGKYTVSLGCAADNKETIDHWEDCAKFNTYYLKQTPYVTLPDIKIKIGSA